MPIPYVNSAAIDSQNCRQAHVSAICCDILHYEKFHDGTVKYIEDEVPFEVPEGWEWTRISTTFILNPRNTLNDDTEVSFIPMPLIIEGYANKHSYESKKWREVKKGFTK